MGFSRVTSVSGASFHLHKVYTPRFTRVKGDAIRELSVVDPALQLSSSLCLSVAHILEYVLDSLYLRFCEEPWSWLQSSSGAGLIWHCVPLPVLTLKFLSVLHWFSWSGFGEALGNHFRKAMAFVSSVLAEIPPETPSRERDSWLCNFCSLCSLDVLDPWVPA